MQGFIDTLYYDVVSHRKKSKNPKQTYIVPFRFRVYTLASHCLSTVVGRGRGGFSEWWPLIHCVTTCNQTDRDRYKHCTFTIYVIQRITVKSAVKHSLLVVMISKNVFSVQQVWHKGGWNSMKTQSLLVCRLCSSQLRGRPPCNFASPIANIYLNWQ